MDREKGARSELQLRREDAVSFTLAEAATGKRGDSTARHRAREILRDEERALRLRDSRTTVTLFDSETQRNTNVGWKFFHDRADASRKSFNGLKSDERNPLDDAAKALQSAGAALKNAAAELANVEIEIDAR